MTADDPAHLPAAEAQRAGVLAQGDLLSGLAAAVTGLGAPPPLPEPQPEEPADHADELWTVTFVAPTGWYVICSHDCDLVRDVDDEPTVTIAPVVWLPRERWQLARTDSYSSRFFALPNTLDGAPDDHAPAVDLAWMTSVARGSLSDPRVSVRHPFTGPQRRQFANWLGWRAARAPFPDVVVDSVLDPAFHVRSRLMKRHAKATDAGQQAPTEARVVGACVAWYARYHQPNVALLGRVTPESLAAAGLVNDDGTVSADTLEKGRVKLEGEIRKRMQRTAPNTGFGVSVSLRSFDQLRADEAETFSLLMR